MTFESQGFVTPLWSYANAAAADTSLDELASVTANAVVLDIHLYVDGKTANEVRLESPGLAQTLSIAMAQAAASGIEIWVKPLVIMGSGPDFLSWQQLAPSDPARWFATYTARLVELASLAEAAGATHFLLTNELYSMTTNPAYQGYWSSLITQVRSVFTGEIGFNAGGLLGGEYSTANEFLAIPDALYSLVDFVGISSYPRLSSASSPDAAMLEAGWTADAFGANLDALLESLYARNSLPVYFTEMGSPPYLGGNYAYFGNIGRPISTLVDPTGQSIFYDVVIAHIEKFHSHRVEGMFMYAWLLDAAMSQPNGLVGSPYDWSIADKASRAVISEWFQGIRQYDPNYFGTQKNDTIHAGDQDDLIHNSQGSDWIFGGVGNDRFMSDLPGPQELPVLRVTLHSGILAGVASRLGVWLNGTKIATLQVAPDQAGVFGDGQPYTTTQTFDVSLGDVTSITELKLVHENDQYNGPGQDRNAFIESITLAGSAIPETASTYFPQGASAVPGTWDLYQSGYILLNAAQLSLVLAEARQDSNVFDGGPGIDTVVCALPASSYTVLNASSGFSVEVTDAGASSTSLVGVERIHFADGNLALDLEGHAGAVAKILGVVFAPSMVGNAGYVGIGLSIMDGGMSYETLMQLALDVRLGTQPSNEEVVSLLYTNLFGVAPPQYELAYYAGLLDAGVFTQAGLAILAAGTSLNLANIDLVGLSETGIEYV